MSHRTFGHIIIAIALLCAPALSSTGRGETIDRVIAYINDNAITMRELNATHSEELKKHPGQTREQTLESMINSQLIIIEAKKLRISAETDPELIQKYLSLKVRSLVYVKDSEIMDYYQKHMEDFQGLRYRNTKERIRQYLGELKFNSLIKEQLEKLRQAAVIRILEL